MDEETIVAAGEEATTTTSTESTVESYVNADGTFKQGWTEALVPEDFRGLGVFKTVTDLPSVMKQLGNLERLRGKQGKGVIPPDENSTPTERDMFYESLGRPKTSAEYKMEVPKDVEQYLDKNALESVKETMHKLGITQTQAAGLMTWQAETVKKQVAALQAATEAQYAAGLEEINKRWGAAAPERTAIVQKLLGDYMNPDDKEAIEEAVNKNPLIADLLSNIGKRMVEAKSIDTSATSTAMTPGEAKEQAKSVAAELAADSSMKWNNPGKYDRLNKELTRLTELSLAGQS